MLGNLAVQLFLIISAPVSPFTHVPGTNLDKIHGVTKLDVGIILICPDVSSLSGVSRGIYSFSPQKKSVTQ